MIAPTNGVTIGVDMHVCHVLYMYVDTMYMIDIRYICNT